jgi:hypothetical protein
MKDEADAKRMFFEYACNSFFMSHDGVYEEFKRYGISEAQEKEWRREYIVQWIGRLEVDDLTPVNRLHDAWASEALPALIEMASKGDSYAKLWYANAIWHLANGSDCSMILRWKARKAAIDLWQLLQAECIELTQAHKEHIRQYLWAFHASIPEEYVRIYASRQLKSAQSQQQKRS